MKALAEQINDIDGVNIYGRVVGVRGLMVEVAGPIHAMSVGARIVIETGGNRFIPAEVIGFSGNNAVVMPFAGLEGVRRGCRAVIANAAGQVRPSPSWLGRVLNAMGDPIDGKGPLTQGPSPMPYRNLPPPGASARRSISACARSTPPSPAAVASGSASSPVPASENPCCCRCWRAMSMRTSR